MVGNKQVGMGGSASHVLDLDEKPSKPFLKKLLSCSPMRSPSLYRTFAFITFFLLKNM